MFPVVPEEGCVFLFFSVMPEEGYVPHGARGGLCFIILPRGARGGLRSFIVMALRFHFIGFFYISRFMDLDVNRSSMHTLSAVYLNQTILQF